MTRDAGWVAYLDGLEVALADLEACLETGRSPAWPQIVSPSTPAPADLVPRGAALSLRVAEVTSRLEDRRDALHQQLTTVPARRPLTATAQDGAMGRRFDLRG